MRTQTLVAVCLVLFSCQANTEKLGVARRAVMSPEELAREILSKRYDVEPKRVSFDQVAHAAYAHRADQPTLLKWRIDPKTVGTIALDLAGKELDEGILERKEAEFIRDYGLRMAPSLRQRFSENSGGELAVKVTFIPAASMDFSRWDEASEVKDDDLLAARRHGIEQLTAETTARAKELSTAFNASIIDIELNAALFKLTEFQARDIARITFVSELTLAPNTVTPEMIPLMAEEGESTGIYSFSLSNGAYGGGIGVLVHEQGAPWDMSGFFPQNTLGMYKHESQGTLAALTHARQVFAILSNTFATNRGMSPDASFGLLTERDGLLFSSDIGRLTQLVAGTALNAPPVPYRVYNGSYGLSRLPSDVNTSLGDFSHSFDALAWSAGFTSVFANGNTNARYTSPDVSATPANGFNSIAVGGTDDSRTPLDASDDTVAAESAFIGPPSLHHDRVKPEVLAPYAVCTIPGAGCGSGTSFAAPLVTGLVADLMEKLPIARGRPDTVKALLVANGRAIAGSQVGAGFGQVSGVKLTGAMPWGSTRGLYMARTATCSALRATTDVVELTSADAFPIRVAMTWLSNGSNGAPTNEPIDDLDLVIVQLSNDTVVATSSRFDSTIEVVDFTPIPNERFAVRVSARRCNSGMVPFTVAWRSSGASLQAVPSTIGSAP
jgi:hypothetical protein